MEVSSPYFDPEYENLNEKIYGPKISVDNEACQKCTVVKVDSLNEQGLLLKVVQVLSDLDLLITKGYISYDAGWFMDVFHVRDQLGNKVIAKNVINYMQQAIGSRKEHENSGKSKICNDDSFGAETSSECTAIEMIGINRPGLFSEISAALAEERCNVIEAHAWSHNASLACVAYVSDESTSSCINDPNRLSTIEEHLSIILGPSNGENDYKGVKTYFLECDSSMSDAERRLHQLMLANGDFDYRPLSVNKSFSSMKMGNYEGNQKTIVSIDQCNEKGYSVVNVKCFDRPRLMFDTVCTLTDMQYVVFHANIASHGSYAHQEYFIRHKDGCILDAKDEAQRVAKCLEAAIERRVCEGIRLELDAQNSGVLPYVTRTLREYGLTVARADVAIHEEKMKNVFYVQDISGQEVDMDVVESIKKELQPLAFDVRNEMLPQKFDARNRDDSSFVNVLKCQLERLSRSFNSM